jgi:putative membrane protein
MMGGWYGGGMGYGAWTFMGLFWVILLGVVIWAIVRLLPGHRDASGGQAESAEEILDRRFARGEIDLETYQAQRAALASAHGMPGGRR